ncbi:reductase AKOR2 [Coniophora puteana RWD-64-598 SS2]|uniref:Reductase AKOR2 n=1 Tax=Coniophora puteana (strain RWD-64-598) TaxID=741705 RepID=A0A5M3MYX6_CONPW|nr:reductase AKOR2 [Coniophora puteana RWD-64-598 SS2]EIW84342.1 reductase AKOR2 [Coniophora puteana RWD-64-598 SS2]
MRLIPGLGCFATWDEEKQKEAKHWILSALKSGYRHLDTAWIYGTEGSVGEAIRESGIDRKEITVTTKLPWHHPGYVLESIDESLRAAKLDYFDLYLVHYPQAVGGIRATEKSRGPERPSGSHESYYSRETWADMEKVLASGKVKAIGISFSEKTLKELLQTAKVIPAMNQIEMHPFLAQTKLLQFCEEHGIKVTAYTPTAYEKGRTDPVIVEIAKKYGVSPPQAILAWHVKRGRAVTTKSTNEAHQRENHMVSTVPFTYSAVLAGYMNALDCNLRLCKYPNEQGMVYGWTVEQLGWD